MPNFSYKANQKFIYQALWKYTKFEKFPRATKIHRKFCTPVWFYTHCPYSLLCNVSLWWI